MAVAIKKKKKIKRGGGAFDVIEKSLESLPASKRNGWFDAAFAPIVIVIVVIMFLTMC